MTHCITGLKVKNHSHIRPCLLDIFPEDVVTLPKHQHIFSFETLSGARLIAIDCRNCGVSIYSAPWMRYVNMDRFIEDVQREMHIGEYDLRYLEGTDTHRVVEITFAHQSDPKRKKFSNIHGVKGSKITMIINEEGRLDDLPNKPALKVFAIDTVKSGGISSGLDFEHIGHYKNGLLHSPDDITPAFTFFMTESSRIKMHVHLICKDGYLHSENTCALDVKLGSRIYKQCYRDGLLQSLDEDNPAIYIRTTRNGWIKVHADKGHLRNGDNTLMSVMRADGHSVTCSIKDNMPHCDSGPAMVQDIAGEGQLHCFYYDGAAFSTADEYGFYNSIDTNVMAAIKLQYDDENVFY